MNSRTGISVRVNLITEIYIPVYAPILIFLCLLSLQTESFFWSAFSHISIKYKDILLCYSPNLILVRENTDQKKLLIWTLYTQCSFRIKPKPDKSDKPD